MKRILAVLLCLFVPTVAFASDNSYKVIYDGGSVQDLKAGKSLQLVILSASVLLVDGKNTLVTIPAASITEISYGQDVRHPRGRLDLQPRAGAPLLSNDFASAPIHPGDAIVVPEKPIRPPNIRILLDYSQILSSFGFAAAAISVLR
jgi:hypothetical protein